MVDTLVRVEKTTQIENHRKHDKNMNDGFSRLDDQGRNENSFISTGRILVA